jgi:3',5'-cyclic AMP phosphodiesterase CpdA
VKIVHLTDIHVHVRPRLGDLWNKRLIGSTNLYLLGRERKFSGDSQRAAVVAAVAETPDVVVISGDLTAQGLDTEFLAARALLAPILDHFPTVIIPGNHDVYIREPTPAATMRRHFGAWMGEGTPSLRSFGSVSFLSLETCRPTLLSSGALPRGELARAASLLDGIDESFVFWVQHYPLLDRKGDPYGPATRSLANAESVREFLKKTNKIGAVLHGHEHHGFTVDIPSGAGPIPILDPGSSGYAWLPDQGRTAHFNVYEADQNGILDIQRMRFDGDRFVPEPGGPYATGR